MDELISATRAREDAARREADAMRALLADLQSRHDDLSKTVKDLRRSLDEAAEEARALRARVEVLEAGRKAPAIEIKHGGEDDLLGAALQMSVAAAEKGEAHRKREKPNGGKQASVSADVLRRLRISRGLSPAALAEQAELPETLVLDLDSGHRKRIAREEAEQLAAALDVEVEALK